MSRSIVKPVSGVVAMFGCIAGVARGDTGLIPLPQLGTGLYLGQFQGGLYPGGVNVAPAAHYAVGRQLGLDLTPLDTLGRPVTTGGTILFMSLGYSNSTQEFSGGHGGGLQYEPWTFMGQAMTSPVFNAGKVTVFDGAHGGQDAVTWDSPDDSNYGRVVQQMTASGLSPRQVQAAWVDLADADPVQSLPAATADARLLLKHGADVVRAMKVTYPNLKQAFLSSRTYGGWSNGPLNPEPFAYEGGFAMKWLIEAQIKEMATGVVDPTIGSLNYLNGTAPWLAWGPYDWADGDTPRADGLTWPRSDFDTDGTHPNTAGETKAGTLLLDFFRTSPYTQPWFTDPTPGDATVDGGVNFADLVRLAQHYNTADGAVWTDGDFNGDGTVNFADLVLLAQHYQRNISVPPGALTSDTLPNGFAGDWALAQSLVPEPVSLATLAAVGSFVARRRRRGGGRRGHGAAV